MGGSQFSRNAVLVNHPPEKVNNNGLFLKKGGYSAIGSGALNYIDPEGTTITYTLITPPLYGALILQGTPLSDKNSIFTQPDIDAGGLYYHHRFGNSPDFFDFSVMDANALTTGPDTFHITIDPFIPGERVYVDLNAPGPIHDGTSWENAILGIQDGTYDATLLELSEVWVADGIYSETVEIYQVNNLGVYGGFEGYGGKEETDIDQRDWENHPTIVNPTYGKIAHETAIGFDLDTVKDFTLDGFTITGGYIRRDYTNGGSGFVCFYASGRNKIVNCVIKNNIAEGNNDAGPMGGGILVASSNITFERCAISDNFSSGSIYTSYSNIKGSRAYGGGGSFYSSSLSFNDCSITSNTALAGYGKGGSAAGGDAFGGGLYFDSCHVSMTDTRISGNVVSGGYAEGDYSDGGDAKGGGFYFTSGTLQMNNCSIEGNLAKGGDGVGLKSPSGGWSYSGGIYSDNSSNDLTNCLIAGNMAVSGDATLPPGEDGRMASASAFGGGATFLSKKVQIKNCQFVSNQAIGGKTIFSGNVDVDREGGLGGGGILLSGMQTTIQNSFISGNKTIRMGVKDSNPSYGGGLLGEIVGELKITNCVISGNFSTDYGGGIFYYDSGTSATVTLQNCMIGSNASNAGGGLVTSRGEYFLNNCIFDNNENHAIYESGEDLDPIVSNCLFYNNPNGDYFNYDSFPHTIFGSFDINKMPNATGNVDGDPLFVMHSPWGVAGTWTSVKYDSINDVTILTNASEDFTPGELAGILIQPDENRRTQTHVISNDAKSLRVWGDQTSVAQSGDKYKIVDYRLSSKDSSALDRGAPEGAPLFDLDDRSRPIDFPGIGSDGPGEGFDIGAYEFQTINNNGFLMY